MPDAIVDVGELDRSPQPSRQLVQDHERERAKGVADKRSADKAEGNSSLAGQQHGPFP